MNNSFIRFEDDEEPDASPKIEERESELVHTIELVQRIRLSEDWSSLKEKILDGLTSRLEKELLEEAKKEDPNTNKLNRIAGELKWAKRYSDFEEYEKTLRVELKAIRKRYGNKSE